MLIGLQLLIFILFDMGLAWKTFDTILVGEYDSNPSSGGGVEAPIGSRLFISSTADVYLKIGAGNTAWYKISKKVFTGKVNTSGSDAVFYLTTDGTINGGQLFSSLTFISPTINSSSDSYIYSTKNNRIFIRSNFNRRC